jgi:ATP-dependent DNA helicase 2 subunit 2
MGAIIENQILNSLGEANYDRVVKELYAMKDELIAYEEPSLYNDFLRRLKKTILQNELTGDRRELWWLIRRSNVGLIEKSMLELSNVTEQEAREVGSP